MNNSRFRHIIVLMLVMFCLAGSKLRSQNALFDSLIIAIDTLQGIEKVIKLQNTALLFERTSLKKGMYFVEESEKLLMEHKDDSLLALNYNILGRLNFHSGLYTLAEKHYNTSLEIYSSINNHNGKATETHNLGIIYLRKEDTIKALDYFKQSLDARFETNNNRRIGDGLTTLGEVYNNFGEYEKSISFLTRALEYYADENIYMRKFDCYSLLSDNFLFISPERSMEWIAEMENMYANDTSGTIISEYKVAFVKAKFNFRTGNFIEAIEWLEKIDNNSLNLQIEHKDIVLLKELSERLFDIGEVSKSLELAAIVRQIKRLHEDEHIQLTINEYRTRLDLRSTEEEIERAVESNSLVLERLKTERLLKYAMFFIVLILSSIVFALIINFINLKRDQAILSKKNIELNNAYDKRIAYKESILSLRENKALFFNILADKLLIPFTDLTSRLNVLSESAKRSFNKKTFLADLGIIYSLSISIEKSLKRILVWSKLQRQKYDLYPVFININDYLHGMLPDILKMSLKQDIRVSFDIDQGLNIMFDRKALRSIIKIFIENSIENSSKKSEIIVRAKKAKGGAILSVTDYGIGIDPKLQENLFNIKGRDEFTQDSNYKKLGLGLIMSRHLAELNNSYISFESTLNKGTTFYLHIKKENG